MSWVLMVAVGLGLMFAMRYTPPWLDFVLVRVAAAAFAGAGTIGAIGWVGRLMQTLVGWLVGFVDWFTSAAVGEAAAWIIVAGVGALWVGALLPDKLFSYDPPDWLIFTGLVLPGLLTSVPGKAGDGLSTVVEWAGQGLVNAVGGLF